MDMTPQAPMGLAGTPAPGGMISPNGVASQDPHMGMLIQALMKQKQQNLLKGQLPGTTPNSLGQGTGGSDFATGPQTPAQGVLNTGSGPQLA